MSERCRCGRPKEHCDEWACLLGVEPASPRRDCPWKCLPHDPVCGCAPFREIRLPREALERGMLEDLGVNTRVHNVLVNHFGSPVRIASIAQMSETEFMSLPYAGKKSLAVLRVALARYGLHLRNVLLDI